MHKPMYLISLSPTNYQLFKIMNESSSITIFHEFNNKNKHILLIPTLPKTNYTLLKNILPFINIKYEMYSNTLILSKIPSQHILNFLKLQFNLILLQEPIQPNILRTPKHKILHDKGGIAHTIQKHTKFYWDPRLIMFSKGNINERIRMYNIGKLSKQNEIVLDLYCGIGYLLLPFLNANKSAVGVACEMNCNSVRYLIKNVIENGMKNRVMVCYGDNLNFTKYFKDKFNRIIMGYLWDICHHQLIKLDLRLMELKMEE